MNTSNFLKQLSNSLQVQQLFEILKKKEIQNTHLKGVVGSLKSAIVAHTYKELPSNQLIIFPQKEDAAYFYNDLQNLLGEEHIVFYPNASKKPYGESEEQNNGNVVVRTDVLNKISKADSKLLIITYPKAVSENVISKVTLQKNTLELKVLDQITTDFIIDLLIEFGFERVDFVVNPGEFALRGGIVDIFSFAHDNPYRIEFFGNEIETIREYEPVSQLSICQLKEISIIPNIQTEMINEIQESFLSYLPKNTFIWTSNFDSIVDEIGNEYQSAIEAFKNLKAEKNELTPDKLFTSASLFKQEIAGYKTIELSSKTSVNFGNTIEFTVQPQPNFNKNFELLIEDLTKNSKENFTNFIFADNQKQLDRLHNIFEDIKAKNTSSHLEFNYEPINIALHEGFIEKDLKIACYTDHQIFDRYQRFRLKENYSKKQALTIKDLNSLKPGDFVTHIDHGIGKFSGLEKIDINGKKQEAIRLIYKDNDVLYVSIHSLHRISKYSSSEGALPIISKIGSKAWSNLKSKTKSKIKEIAFSLIKLYAERRASKGFAFSPDNYLQNELEASFIYEDTPDQNTATIAVKKDMELERPMDRLICGDVGFGKTEVAIRAAFKAVCDSKQVAVLVPTTILAYQHANSFKERLKDLPCRVDYLNRFRSQKEQTQVLEDLKEGKIDILIGTHILAGSKIKFHDLGLLIVDEEQKFGVGTKEKLKTIKKNVDTLTLTATPIPRTLQFSMMGSRDISAITTPPPNRYPIHTELASFDEKFIHDTIMYEVSRNGQVFFVHNRVQNINEVASMLEKICPNVKVLVAHGQMKGHELEDKMLSFINGDYDVLVATTIIESGLDIPNANTIIINNANHFGLSDLHQMRGRVGRSNKKAFCYLLTAPLSSLTKEARKRLQTIEEFSDLGSGFNIAMRDLDIRGAGDLLGGDQSGFINEMGYETYQKILDEALQELKETEFKDTFAEDEVNTDFVKECQIDTDLEILFPDDYVTNIAERLSLYKELDSCKNAIELDKFEKNLIDRFGEPPAAAKDLLKTIELRWIAKEIGFEKLILKQDKLIGHFIQNQDSDYFQSESFNKILHYLQHNHKNCEMKESAGKLKLTFNKIDSVEKAIGILNKIYDK